MVLRVLRPTLPSSEGDITCAHNVQLHAKNQQKNKLKVGLLRFMLEEMNSYENSWTSPEESDSEKNDLRHPH